MRDLWKTVPVCVCVCVCVCVFSVVFDFVIPRTIAHQAPLVHGIFQARILEWLDCKEIQPVHSEGDSLWDFFGRNDAEA